jgi:hypothetical protein
MRLIREPRLKELPYADFHASYRRVFCLTSRGQRHHAGRRICCRSWFAPGWKLSPSGRHRRCAQGAPESQPRGSPELQRFLEGGYIACAAETESTKRPVVPEDACLATIPRPAAVKAARAWADLV